MYIGSTKTNTYHRISSDEQPISVLSGTKKEILRSGSYKLSYDGTSLYVALLYDGNSKTLTLWSTVVPSGTELITFFIKKAREQQRNIDKTKNVDFQPWILNTRYPGIQPEHVVLTTYGDLLIMERNRQYTKDRIFWSSYRSTLIDAGYVNNIFPDTFETEAINPSFKVKGKPFKEDDPETWSYNVYNTFKDNHGYEEREVRTALLANKEYVYGKVSGEDWIVALLTTNDDLQMVAWLRKDRDNKTDPAKPANKITVMWSLKNILTKLNGTEPKFDKAIQNLEVRNGEFIVGSGGGGVVHKLATGIGEAKKLCVNSVGDLLLIKEDSTVVWSFYGDLVYKVRMKQIKMRSELDNSSNMTQPTLTDTDKRYVLEIKEATLKCKDESEFNIIGWFVTYVKDKVKKTSDTLPDVWTDMKTHFLCSTIESLTVKWKFNTIEKTQTFKNSDSIIFTFDTSCVGDYDPCVNNLRTWTKTYDSYPSTTPCPAPSTAPCTAPSTEPPITEPPITEPPITEPKVKCVGSWGEFGECKDGKKTKTYTVTTDASGGGTACVAKDGDTRTEDCSTPWYTNPLILGGIGIAVMMIIGLLMFVLMSKK
jgi:hypothetical protein